jgi:Zn-dependent protease with chaperone function
VVSDREECETPIMSLLLMVFLTLVCLPEATDYPAPFGIDSPAVSTLITWLGVGFVALHAFLIARRVRVTLGRDSGQREQALQRYERARFRHLVGLFAVYGLSLLVFGWGWAIGQFWARDEQSVRSGAELLLLAPFLTGQLLSWFFFYDADRSSHQAARRTIDTDPFARSWLDSPPPARQAIGGRLAYLVFQFRQKLGLVCIPVLLLIAQKECVRLFPLAWQQWQGAANIAGFLLVVGVFVTMPWVVRLVLGLQPLPEGPLRQRLLTTGRRLGFRCSNLLLWNTRSGMANAMVVGVVPWVRYVVFTDRLLEDFSEDEVEAVFGHEVGHVRYHHMLYYVGFLMVSIAVFAILVDFLGKLWHLEQYKYLFPFWMIAFILSYIFVVFGFLSRRCERQADIFGCRTVSCGHPYCYGHEPGTPLAPGGQALCPTGIRTFIRALEKVAEVNGISRDRPGFFQSWQHSTIARRVEFLQGMLVDPGLEAYFQRRVTLVKWLLFFALGAALALLLKLHGWEMMTGPTAEGHNRPQERRSPPEDRSQAPAGLVMLHRAGRRVLSE